MGLEIGMGVSVFVCLLFFALFCLFACSFDLFVSLIFRDKRKAGYLGTTNISVSILVFPTYLFTLLSIIEKRKGKQHFVSYHFFDTET